MHHVGSTARQPGQSARCAVALLVERLHPFAAEAAERAAGGAGGSSTRRAWAGHPGPGGAGPTRATDRWSCCSPAGFMHAVPAASTGTRTRIATLRQPRPRPDSTPTCVQPSMLVTENVPAAARGAGAQEVRAAKEPGAATSAAGAPGAAPARPPSLSIVAWAWILRLPAPRSRRPATTTIVAAKSGVRRVRPWTRPTASPSGVHEEHAVRSMARLTTCPAPRGSSRSGAPPVPSRPGQPSHRARPAPCPTRGTDLPTRTAGKADRGLEGRTGAHTAARRRLVGPVTGGHRAGPPRRRRPPGRGTRRRPNAGPAARALPRRGPSPGSTA